MVKQTESLHLLKGELITDLSCFFLNIPNVSRCGRNGRKGSCLEEGLDSLGRSPYKHRD